MGFFDKIKQKFKKEETSDVEEKKVQEKQEIYDKGLSKSRKQVTSLLSDLTHRYSKINEDYFNELEEILIMADIGVNTVMKFVDKLKERVNRDKITDPEELIISKEELKNIENKMNELLSDLELEVLELYLSGKSYQYIANMLNRDVKSIDNALQRVKRKLEKHLENRNN